MFSWWRGLHVKMRETFSRPEADEELEEEIRFHLEREAEKRRLHGSTPDEARRGAARAFGKPHLVREWAREEFGFRGARHVCRELRHGVRRLIRDRGFTASAGGTLALGLGATTAIFTVLYAVVLRPLPYPASDRLVWLWHSAPGADIAEIGVSYGTYLHYRDLTQAFEDVAIFHELEVTVRDGVGEAHRVPTAIVSTGFFPLVSSGAPVVGRAIQEADGAAEAPRVVLISYRYWLRQYGGDPSVLGRTLEIGGTPGEIVGVLPASFDYPSPDTDLWYQIRLDPARVPLGQFNASAIGRLQPGVTIQAARRELADLIRRLDERYPGGAYEAIVRRGQLTAHLQPLKDHVVGGDVRGMLWIVLGTVGFVLLIACTNLTNLMLVRMEGRRREMAVRAALGAGRKALRGTFLGEPILLSAFGGVLGLLLAIVGVDLLLRLGSRMLPRVHEIGLSLPVLLFTAGLCVLTALAIGLVPLILHRPDDVGGSLMEGRRGSTAGRKVGRTRDLLAVAQLAFALMLLVGAGLMTRSFWRLGDVDPGFRPRGALTFQVALSNQDYPDWESAARLQQQIIHRLGAFPSVTAVGAGDCVPLACYSNVNPMSQPGQTLGPNEIPAAVQIRTASPGYFRALGIPVLQGREFERSDHEQRTGAALVNRQLVERFWPDEDGLGKRVYPAIGDSLPWYHVVGVVGNAPRETLAEMPEPALYIPMLGTDDRMQAGPYLMNYVVRTTGPPLALGPSVRAAIRELNPAIPVTKLRVLRDLVGDASATMRFSMVLLAIAAAIATILGAVGIYGVLSYGVSQRRNEIGIRLAMGARAGQVRRMVLRRGALVALVGVAIGLAGAIGLTRFLDSLLFGVGSTDPATYLVVSLTLFGVSLAACYLPARRAARLDPASALRAD